MPLWVGRDALLTELTAEILGGRKVLALCGQGGIGKTSLAVKLLEACGVLVSVGRLGADCVFEGALYCQVNESMGFDEIAMTFSQALSIETLGSAPVAIVNQIIAGLSRRRWLVVLDNLESLLQAGVASAEMAELLNRLVYGEHRSQVVITSREVPLDLADRRGKRIDRKLVRVESVMGISVEASIALLRDYAPRVADVDLRWVAERVGGQVFVLTQLGNLLAETSIAYLRKHPELVVVDAEPILREQIDRLTDIDREVLKRMSVLRVPWNAEAIAFLRLCGIEEGSFQGVADLRYENWTFRTIFQYLERFLHPLNQQRPIQKPDERAVNAAIKTTRGTLQRLVNCSQLQKQYDLELGEDQYSLHPVIAEFLQREYAEEMQLLFKYAAIYYSSIAHQEDFTCYEQLKPVLEEMYCYWNMGMTEKVTEIIVESLPGMLRPWGYWTVLRDWMERVLPHTEGIHYRTCLQTIGGVCRDTGDWAGAEKYFRLSLAHAEEHQAKSDIAVSIGQLGSIESRRGNWDKAEQLYRQSLQIQEELGNRSGMAGSWASLGSIESNRGNWDEAEQLFRQYLQVCEELGDRPGMAGSWGVLGDIECGRKNYDSALELKTKSFNLRQELGDRHGMCMSLRTQAGIASEQENWEKAKELINQAMEIAIDLGSPDELAQIIGVQGTIERDRGNLDQAEALLKQALSQIQQLGMVSAIAEINYGLAKLYRAKDNPTKAQEHYAIAHQIFTDLGAMKDVEKMENEEW